jgi:hypothetical protein
MSNSMLQYNNILSISSIHLFWIHKLHCNMVKIIPCVCVCTKLINSALPINTPLMHYMVCSKSFELIFYNFSDMPAIQWASSPSKHSPPTLMHHSQHRCHLWESPHTQFFGITRSSGCKFSIISWIVWNYHPFKVNFSLGNKNTSAGARSGE